MRIRFKIIFFYLGTDGHLTGVALISGTGTICVGFDKTGQSLRATGWGYINEENGGLLEFLYSLYFRPALGDEGSGYALGSHALHAVVQAADEMEQPTLLTQLVLTQLQLKEPSELIAWAYAPESRGEWGRVAALGRAVFAAVSQVTIRTNNNYNRKFDFVYDIGFLF